MAAGLHSTVEDVVLLAICIGRFRQGTLPTYRFPGPSLWYLFCYRRELKENAPWISLQQLAEKFGRDIHCMVSIYHSHSCTTVVIGYIMQISVAGTTIIVLNKAIDAHDLLEKRSAIFSSRPRSVLQGEM